LHVLPAGGITEIPMTIDILLTQPLPPGIDAELTSRYTVHRLYDAPNPDALIDAIAQRVRGVVTGGANGLSSARMDRLPALDIIAINGIGTDAVDLGRARSRGIHVATTPDVLTDDVADMAMGLILMTLRDLGLGERIVRARRWGAVAQPLATQVTGKRLGVTGAAATSTLFAMRFMLGLVESPAFPANSRIVACWFPTSERGTAPALFNSAQYMAVVIFTPCMAWLTHALGREHVFLWMGMLGGVLGGVLSDWLILRGVHPSRARKTPFVIGMAMATILVLANYAQSNAVVIALMTVAFFGKGLAAVGWAVLADTAPEGMVGLSGGVFNGLGNIAGIVTPLVIGYFVASTGSFSGALWFVAAHGLIGIAAYALGARRVKRHARLRSFGVCPTVSRSSSRRSFSSAGVSVVRRCSRKVRIFASR
jgi:MFS family permease